MKRVLSFHKFSMRFASFVFVFIGFLGCYSLSVKADSLTFEEYLKYCTGMTVPEQDYGVPRLYVTTDALIGGGNAKAWPLSKAYRGYENKYNPATQPDYFADDAKKYLNYIAGTRVIHNTADDRIHINFRELGASNVYLVMWYTDSYSNFGYTPYGRGFKLTDSEAQKGEIVLSINEMLARSKKVESPHSTPTVLSELDYESINAYKDGFENNKIWMIYIVGDNKIHGACLFHNINDNTTPFRATDPALLPITDKSVASIPDVTYTGKDIKPFVSVKSGNTILTEGKDYTLKYYNNKNPGKAHVVITGKGRCVGKVVKFFNITEDDTWYTDISYRTYVQSYGWQGWVNDGSVSGTYGQGKRLEGIQIKFSLLEEYSGSIQYRTYVQKLGWRNWSKNGAFNGTKGKGLRLEAIQIKLGGSISKHYDVYYRVYAQKFGWLGWAKNGASSGTSGFGYRLESIQIKPIPKGTKFNVGTKKPYRKR